MERHIQEQDIFAICPATALKRKNSNRFHLAGALEHLLGLRRCSAIYQSIGHHRDPAAFMRHLLKALGIRPTCASADTQKIPPRGPCVVVSNHPFGGLDGIVLAELLLTIRADVKILANSILNRIPQLREITIPVDPFQTRTALRSNIGPLRDAMAWVESGGLLLVFPAGEVSHPTLRSPEIADPPWHRFVARMIRRTRANVIPVYFKGCNRWPFQLAGLLHPRLRTALLARELLARKGKPIELKIGNLIHHRWLRNYSDDQMLKYLRFRTYVMGHARPLRATAPTPAVFRGLKQRRPLADPQPREVCRRELLQLPGDQLLLRSGNFAVWHAQSTQIPHLLLEIGRLRETAFRLAGEGTGRACDLDRFDAHYTHLFIWDTETEQIIGAYRLGLADQILSRQGKKGLYTNTLFHSRSAFFDKLGPALELGRSFVHPDYQKSYSPLLLLWKGIGAFVARYPRYRMLFGPVSISNDYSDLSRRLMATTLLRHSQTNDLAMMVQPRNPAKLKPVRIRGCRSMVQDLHFQDLKEIGAVVSDIELAQKEVPVLLRQYLNLGGQLLAFNVDKHFSKVLDGLIVVDLLQTERKTLARYMGAEGLSAFRAYHSSDTQADPAPAPRPLAAPVLRQAG